jgi:hypothetical protein
VRRKIKIGEKNGGEIKKKKEEKNSTTKQSID